MENRINVAELLKDCPKGMELDCTMFENVTFVRVDMSKKQFPIEIAVGGIHSKYLTKEGCYHDITLLPESKCIIFPKGKTTWEGFVSPRKFKDGDILVHTQNQRFVMSIYHKRITELTIKTHCILWDKDEGLSINKEICCYVDSVRFATEEEKAKLFQAIENNGYRWNEETKTLEKLIEPKFKVGDKIKHKCEKFRDERTIVSYGKNGYWTSINDWIDYENQDDWELVPNKFDISTLKPFESRVLIRDHESQKWRPAIWGAYEPEPYFPYKLIGTISHCCIPYEGNEHLLNTTNDCDEFYKTWE